MPTAMLFPFSICVAVDMSLFFRSYSFVAWMNMRVLVVMDMSLICSLVLFGHFVSDRAGFCILLIVNFSSVAFDWKWLSEPHKDYLHLMLEKLAFAQIMGRLVPMIESIVQ